MSVLKTGVCDGVERVFLKVGVCDGVGRGVF